MECRKGGPFDIGFVDPNRVHEEVVRTKPGQTEDFIAKVFTETTNQKGNTIALQLLVSIVTLSCTHSVSAYSMLSLTDDELCVRRFHFILLVIQPDSGKVLVMDSLRKEKELWADFRKMLQR